MDRAILEFKAADQPSETYWLRLVPESDDSMTAALGEVMNELSSRRTELWLLDSSLVTLGRYPILRVKTELYGEPAEAVCEAVLDAISRRGLLHDAFSTA